MLVWLGIYGACLCLHIFLVGDVKLTIDKCVQRLHMVELSMNISSFLGLRVLFVPVWCGTLQFLKFDTIMCACMVRHINVNYLWHYDVAQSSFKSFNTFI
jgi:hypothetical protein